MGAFPVLRLRGVLTAAAAAAAVRDAPFCGSCENGGAPPMSNTFLTLSCEGAGSVITALPFVSYGTPQQKGGTCGGWARGACDAANATALVSAACMGLSSCTVYPNTTTFGDPCYGTVKALVVVATCSIGTGVATCSAVPPAPPPGPPNVTVAVAVDWTAPAVSSFQAEPSIQVVSQHYLFKDSPDAGVYTASWEAAAALGVRRARLATWFPYAKVAVAELDPPSGPLLCGPRAWSTGQSQPFTLSCPGSTIADVAFASWGTPTGTCGAYSVSPSCADPGSLGTVRSACVGQPACTLAPAMFTTPAGCGPGAKPYLAVQVSCADPALRHAYWNATLLDGFWGDFWTAMNGSVGLRAASGGVLPPGGVPGGIPLPSLSTNPTWLYSPTEWRYQDDPLAPDYSYNRGTAPAGNLSALGAYAGRVYSWLTLGGFTDEYGVYHGGGNHYDVDYVEIGNEVDYEHGHTPASYTLEFDAIVGGLRAAGVDTPSWPLRYNGLNLPNIDDTDTVVAWATYFLNGSNHAPAGVWDAGASASIGYHAYPTGGHFTPDPTSLAGFFDYVEDTFVPKVQAVDAVIRSLSPHTRTILDECGVDADGALQPGAPPGNGPRFWVASGSYFLFLVARVNALPSHTVVQVGHSQLMDAPGQEPSVTLLDWSTGRGTAAYWGTWLAVRAWSLGDALLPTSSSNASAVHAVGWLHTPAPGRPDLPGASGAPTTPRLLLVNRRNAWANVTLPAPPSGGGACTAWVLDERAGLEQPPQVDCTDTSTGGGALLLWPYASAVVEFS